MHGNRQNINRVFRNGIKGSPKEVDETKWLNDHTNDRSTPEYNTDPGKETKGAFELSTKKEKLCGLFDTD